MNEELIDEISLIISKRCGQVISDKSLNEIISLCADEAIKAGEAGGYEFCNDMGQVIAEYTALIEKRMK